MFFIGGSLLVSQKSRRPVESASPVAPEPVEKLGNEVSEDSTVVLNNFHRSETKNGKVVWEVTAEQGQYSPDKASVILTKAVLFVYQKDNSKVALSADKATLFLDGTALKSAEVTGSVKVHNEKALIETDLATWDNEKNLVHAPGIVSIKTESMDVSGKDMTVNITSKELFLASDVTSTVKPKQLKNKK